MTEIHLGSIAKLRKVIHEKNKEHKKYINDKPNFLLLQNINNLQAQIKTLIDILKQKYFSQTSQKLEINTKCYWSLLQKFLNNKKKDFILNRCILS